MYAYERLAVVTLGGYKPVTEGSYGSLDWLVATHDAQTPDESRHVLAVDLDRPGHEFAVLVDQAEVARLLELAKCHGYTHRDTRVEESVGYFGDGVDQVAICRHPDGWIVLPA